GVGLLQRHVPDARPGAARHPVPDQRGAAAARLEPVPGGPVPLAGRPEVFPLPGLAARPPAAGQADGLTPDPYRRGSNLLSRARPGRQAAFRTTASEPARDHAPAPGMRPPHHRYDPATGGPRVDLRRASRAGAARSTGPGLGRLAGTQRRQRADAGPPVAAAL